MTTIFVRHAVADFGVWKAGFEADVDRRQQRFVTSSQVFRMDGDENMVLNVFETNDPAEFARMMGDPDLAEAMNALRVPALGSDGSRTRSRNVISFG